MQLDNGMHSQYNEPTIWNDKDDDGDNIFISKVTESRVS